MKKEKNLSGFTTIVFTLRLNKQGNLSRKKSLAAIIGQFHVAESLTLSHRKLLDSSICLQALCYIPKESVVSIVDAIVEVRNRSWSASKFFDRKFLRCPSQSLRMSKNV